MHAGALEGWGFGLEGATFCNLFLNGAWSNNSKRYTYSEGVTGRACMGSDQQLENPGEWSVGVLCAILTAFLERPCVQQNLNKAFLSKACRQPPRARSGSGGQHGLWGGQDD